jgi:hypothetical protein
MSTPVRASDRDLRALAAIVTQDRADLPDGEGLPPSLLADMMGQIRCDLLGLDSWDSGRQMCWFSQNIPSGDAAIDFESTDQVFWENYWDCQHCSYAARTGDQRSVIKVADFYSARNKAGNRRAGHPRPPRRPAARRRPRSAPRRSAPAPIRCCPTTLPGSHPAPGSLR